MYQFTAHRPHSPDDRRQPVARLLHHLLVLKPARSRKHPALPRGGYPRDQPRSLGSIGRALATDSPGRGVRGTQSRWPCRRMCTGTSVPGLYLQVFSMSVKRKKPRVGAKCCSQARRTRAEMSGIILGAGASSRVTLHRNAQSLVFHPRDHWDVEGNPMLEHLPYKRVRPPAGRAWRSSARRICDRWSRAAGKAGHSWETAGVKPEEGGADGRQWPTLDSGR